MAPRRTSSTTSRASGLPGSGTLSIRTSRGPWKTAPFIASAFDLNLHVLAGISRSVERSSAVSKRERRREQRCLVDSACGHEPDRAWPETDRADDAADLERLRLYEADLDGRGSADVDTDKDDAGAKTGDWKRA